MRHYELMVILDPSLDERTVALVGSAPNYPFGTTDPVPELGEIRDGAGVQSVVSALGNPVYLVTRYEDVKAVLADHEHFSNSRPPGFALPGAPPMSEEELAAASRRRDDDDEDEE